MLKTRLSALAHQIGLNITPENFRVRAEQMRTLSRAYPSMIMANAAMAPLVAWLMWERIDHAHLLLWAGLLYAFHSLEIYHWLTYPKDIGSVAECKRWQRQFLASDSLLGAAWGSTGLFMFVPHEPLYQAFLLCILLGMAAAAVAGNLVFPLSQLIYVILVIVPITLNIFIQHAAAYTLLAIMVLLFLAFVLKVGLDQSKFFELSIQRSFENLELAQQIEKKRLSEEQAHVLKSKFLAAVTHDLRQPLYALNLFHEALLPHVHSNGRELYDQISRASMVLNDMFDSLLDITKLEAGSIKVTQQHFDVHILLANLRDEYAWIAKQKRLQLHIPAMHCAVHTDPELLLRILRNLLSNAIRYTEQGVIRLELTQTNTHLVVALTDTGIGIAPEHLPYIFDEYFQVGRPVARNDKGLGLGLAIVRRLEQMLKYDLKVSSVLGSGTAFVFSIPLGQLAASHENKSNTLVQSA